MEGFQRHKSRLTECVFSEALSCRTGRRAKLNLKTIILSFRASAKIGLNERVEQRHHKVLIL